MPLPQEPRNVSRISGPELLRRMTLYVFRQLSRGLGIRIRDGDEAHPISRIDKHEGTHRRAAMVLEIQRLAMRERPALELRSCRLE